MKLSFRTISQDEHHFQEKYNDVDFRGIVRKKKDTIAFLDAKISGKIPLVCDRCAEEFEENLNEHLEMLISDGFYDGSDENYDIIEAENGLIDFEIILQGELNLIKGDYHYCSHCVEKDTDFTI